MTICSMHSCRQTAAVTVLARFPSQWTGGYSVPWHACADHVIDPHITPANCPSLAAEISAYRNAYREWQLSGAKATELQFGRTWPAYRPQPRLSFEAAQAALAAARAALTAAASDLRAE